VTCADVVIAGRERELEDMEGKAQNSIIYDVTSFDTATAR